MVTSTLPVLDPAPLQRQTMGDRALQVEVLALFVAELERLMHQVERAEDRQVRGDRLRAMIGLARNVGAARLAQTARLLEAQIANEDVDFEPLRAAVSETLEFVRQSGV
jgi:hypothetical protein